MGGFYKQLGFLGEDAKNRGFFGGKRGVLVEK